MSFTWRKFTLFGFAASVPVIAWFVKKDYDAVKIFHRYHADMATCEACSRMFTGRAGPAWISHLMDAHGMYQDMAIDTVVDIYRKMLIERYKKTV